MEPWIVNLCTGLIVVAISLIARVVREVWSGRRGRLAGWWLWITYAPTDRTKSLAIWSIEVCHIRHRPARGDVSTVKGTMWRIFDRDARPHYERRWTFEGTCTADVVEGRYSSTRDAAGSHGVFHVWETDPMIFEGKYIRVVKRGSGQKLHHQREEAWTEWARVPDVLSAPLQTAIGRIPRPAAARLYPWRLRRRLGLGRGTAWNWARSFAAAAAPVDNRLLLEQMSAERAAEAERHAHESSQPLILHRADLGIFPAQLRSAPPPETDLPLAG